MKIIVEFDSMEEFEAFRSSGKKARSRIKEEEPVQEEVAQTAPEPVAPAPVAPTPTPPPGFTPPSTATVHNFPGSNSGSPPTVHPLVTAILARIDGALTTGQSTDAVVQWFRQQIGPDAANATLDQIKQIFIPRMSAERLEQLAPQLGIGIRGG